MVAQGDRDGEGAREFRSAGANRAKPIFALDRRTKAGYSKFRVAVPKANQLKWPFPQEEATFQNL